MGGREGLIDTAVKTGSNRICSSEHAKSMEILRLVMIINIRGSTGSIIQFVYGNDGMDGTNIESQSIYLTKLRHIMNY